MSNYCKNCYDLTEELENHKRWLNDYKQKLQDAEEFANAKITQCANLIKQLNETHEQLDQLKAENEELKKQIDDLLHKPEIQNKILWKIDNEKLLLSKDTYIYKLEKTLTKIKEIAEDESYIGFWDEQISEILQKISECEGNDEN